MGVNSPAQNPLPNKAASEHKDPTTSSHPAEHFPAKSSSGNPERRGNGATVNEQGQSHYQGVPGSDGKRRPPGRPPAPRQSSSAGKSPETSNHTSPPTRTYRPATDLSTKRNRQSSTKNPPPLIAQTDYPDHEMRIADAAINGTSVICAPPRRKTPRPRHPQPITSESPLPLGEG